MVASRLSFWFGVAFTLVQPTMCYRIDMKKLMNLNLSGSELRSRAPPKSVLVSTPAAMASTEAQANVTTVVDAETTSASSLGDFVKLEDAHQFMNSQRTVGNMLAAMGLMRSRVVLGAASSVLPAAFFQNENALEEAVSPVLAPGGGVPGGTTSLPVMVAKIVCCMIFAGAVFGLMKFLLDTASTSKVGDDVVTREELLGACSSAFKIMVPQVMIIFLYMINEIVSTMCIGRVGTKEQLAAVGLCNMMLNAFLMALTFGLTGPMDTFASVAWGAGDKRLVMSYLTTARVLGLLQVLWVVPLFWNAERLFLFLGQDPTVASHAITFCKVIAVMFVPFYFSLSTVGLLKNIGDPMITVLALFCGNFVHIGLCFALVVHGGWGNTGIAFAWAVNQMLGKTIVDIYLVCFSDMKEFGFFKLVFMDLTALKNPWGYISLAIPSVLGGSAESYFWEIITLFIGTMSSTALAAHVATNNVAGFLYMSAVGLTGATCVVTGQYIGAGRAALLRGTSIVFPGLAVSMWAIVFCIVQLSIGRIANLYSNEKEVQDVIVILLSIISVTGFFNSVQIVLQGVLKGYARQKTCAYVVMGNYYLVSVPLAYISTMLHLGVYSVYCSFTFGVVVMAVTMSYVVSRIDPMEEIAKANDRMAQDQKNNDQAAQK